MSWLTPKRHVKDIQVFLGLPTFTAAYSDFQKNCYTILNNLMVQGRQYGHGEEPSKKAFDWVWREDLWKRNLFGSCRLHAPLTLMSSVMLQTLNREPYNQCYCEDEKVAPMCHLYPKGFNWCWKNYECAWTKEMLGNIITSIGAWRHYLEGGKNMRSTYGLIIKKESQVVLMTAKN